MGSIGASGPLVPISILRAHNDLRRSGTGPPTGAHILTPAPPGPATYLFRARFPRAERPARVRRRRASPAAPAVSVPPPAPPPPPPLAPPQPVAPPPPPQAPPPPAPTPQ